MFTTGSAYPLGTQVWVATGMGTDPKMATCAIPARLQAGKSKNGRWWDSHLFHKKSFQEYIDYRLYYM